MCYNLLIDSWSMVNGLLKGECHMMKFDKLLKVTKEFSSTIIRFPIAIMFLVFSAILTSYNISTNNYNIYNVSIRTFLLGASIFLVLQMVYERFCKRKMTRIVFGGLSIIGATLYYLMVEYWIKDYIGEFEMRLMVFMFVLLIGFIWVPSIKSRIGFSESFLVVFKSFFMVVLYSLVLILGISLIIMAIDMLIVNLDGNAYSYALVFVSYVYAPIHFLSLIPIYPPYLRLGSEQPMSLDGIAGDLEIEDKQTQHLKKSIEPSKFLGGLVSYIIIPITAIFTVILLIYIVLNITGDFWKDNLMEPLLVSYSITVIIVYLLASVMVSKTALYFRRVFPKVLIPVVLFQTISSMLKIGETGITSGRYYVILFGIFASIFAVIFSIRSDKPSNIIAPILIVLTLVSILPPTDAFTISKRSQINRLTNVLEDNHMLKDNKIVPNSNLQEEDQKAIISSVQYLSRMDYLKEVSWLASFDYDFEDTFGFAQYGSPIRDSESYRFYLAEKTPIDVSDYDFFVEVSLSGEDREELLNTIPWGEMGYTLVQENKDGIGDLIVRDDQQNELIRYSFKEIFDGIMTKEEHHGEMSMEEAEFIAENDRAIMRIILKSINLDIWDNNQYQHIGAYIMVKIK